VGAWKISRPKDRQMVEIGRTQENSVSEPSIARQGRIADRARLVLLVYSRLGREEASAPLGEGHTTPSLRVEAVEQGMVVWPALPS
jgi:hypothetical protein